MRSYKPARTLRGTSVASVSRVLALLTVSIFAFSLVTVSNAKDLRPTNNIVSVGPTITPVGNKKIKVRQGDLPKNFTVATVTDPDTPIGSLVVTVVSVPPGITVSNIVNTAGVVTADISAACNANKGRKNVKLQVSDGTSTSQANVAVIVQTNAAPTLGGYGTTTVIVNGSTIVNPGIAPSDGGGLASVTVGIAPNTYTGGLSIDPQTGVVSVTNAAPVGDYTVTVQATDLCGLQTTVSFTLTVAPPGNVPPVANAGSTINTACCTQIQLDGTASNDPDGQPQALTYSWMQSTGTPVMLLNADAATPVFESPNVSVAEQLVFVLTVSDSVASNSSSVVVNVSQTTGANATTVAIFATGPSDFFLHNCNTFGNADVAFSFGATGLIPISGDWDGDGVVTIGAFDPATNTFFIKNSNAPGPADLTFTYGAPGDLPLAGDWDGDGFTTVGIYRPSTGLFALKNTNAPGDADVVFQFGAGGGGVVPLAGDFDGDGTTTVGIYVQSTGVFFLKNSNAGGGADVTFSFGAASADNIPLVGNWDGLGGDSIGIYVKSTSVFFLRNTNDFGLADITFQFGPPGGNFTPLAGDWDGL